MGKAMKTEKIKKWFFPLSALVILLIGASVFYLTKTAGQNSAKSSAVHVLETVFSCTQQQAARFEESMQADPNTSAEVGLASGSDTGVTDFFTAQYGDLFTPDGFEQCMANRIFGRSMALSTANQCHIAATEVTVKEHSDTPGIFSYSAVLVDAGSQIRVATISGTIQMEKPQAESAAKKWLAANITATVTNEEALPQ
ncbi:MAG: hypothetical protein PHO10_00690 [Gemmiger sp.]|nr:hypothetical protein [Gemmiger sp.]